MEAPVATYSPIADTFTGPIHSHHDSTFFRDIKSMARIDPATIDASQ